MRRYYITGYSYDGSSALMLFLLDSIASKEKQLQPVRLKVEVPVADVEPFVKAFQERSLVELPLRVVGEGGDVNSAIAITDFDAKFLRILLQSSIDAMQKEAAEEQSKAHCVLVLGVLRRIVAVLPTSEPDGLEAVQQLAQLIRAGS